MHKAVKKIVAVAMALTFGCDRAPDAPPPAPVTTQATVPAPSTAPAQALPVTFNIDGQSFAFPPARLVLSEKDGKVRARLFSIDPPAALRESYQGNSFDFDLLLDIETLDELFGTRYDIARSVADRDDVVTGLFIAGGKQVLQPVQVAVLFDTFDGNDVVLISGQFQLFDNGAAPTNLPGVDASADAAPTQMVTVKARIMPQRVVK